MSMIVLVGLLYHAVISLAIQNQPEYDTGIRAQKKREVRRLSFCVGLYDCQMVFSVITEKPSIPIIRFCNAVSGFDFLVDELDIRKVV